MGNIMQTLTRPLELADEDNRRFICEICTEHTLILGQKFSSIQCSHSFCINCMKNYILIKLEDNVGNIECPALGCTQKLYPTECAAVIGRLIFVWWCDVLCAAAVLHLDKCYCPYRDCNEVIVNECGDSVRESNCPKCQRLFCFECKSARHMGIGCEENRVRLFGDRNDVTLGRLVERENWMRCPRCWHFVVKVEGCRIVKCRCGMDFCYNCEKSVENGWCPCDEPSTRSAFIAFKFLLGLVGWIYFLGFLLRVRLCDLG